VSSRSRASINPRARKPKRAELPAREVQEFRQMLDTALNADDPDGRIWSNARWGVYAFYDYDGEPIYVGQTNERLRTRIRRHLTNQRTDAVAMRILDVFEVAEMELWPLWDFEERPKEDPEAKATLNAAEYTAYYRAIQQSRFKAILNEKIPPVSPTIQLPTSERFPLISPQTRQERGHPDIRIARRAETVSRLASVAYERGEVSDGLRRVLVIQAVRLAYISAVHLAYVEGRKPPNASAISVEGLVGTVLYEHSDPHGQLRMEEAEEECNLP